MVIIEKHVSVLLPPPRIPIVLHTPSTLTYNGLPLWPSLVLITFEVINAVLLSSKYLGSLIDP